MTADQSIPVLDDQPADKPAVIMAGTGRTLTYGTLAGESKRLAQLFRERGLMAGGHVAILMDNNERYFSAVWAARRAELYYTPVNWHLTAGEASHIVADCGAEALVASASLAELAAGVLRNNPAVKLALSSGGAVAGFEDFDRAIATVSADALPDEREGSAMFYSSGTTGRPKGITPALSGDPFGTPRPIEHLLGHLYGFTPDTVYLCPGPLYHAAPLGWSLNATRLGAQVVVMGSFDAEQTLALIEKHRVTHVQFVPTMFIRMLRLPAEVRHSYDLSSLQKVVHAAAPCPVPVKRQMIEWLGPIIEEYYAGSEANCYFGIDSATWLERVGSVGRALFGVAHVLDENGVELPAGEVGQIWIEGTPQFSYHNDPEKTANAVNDRGWSTLGDLGHLDEDGFLYLADRRADLILSGGVNIYPQEVEDVLLTHPSVGDVAVIGVPNPDFGEEVKAVVQVRAGIVVDEQLPAQLIAFARERLAAFKCPRSVDFDDELPRLPSGKLLRRQVKERYRLGGSN